MPSRLHNAGLCWQHDWQFKVNRFVFGGDVETFRCVSEKMTDSFWAGARGSYADGLRKQYERQLADLQTRCDAADRVERARLEAEMERIESEYQSKLESIDDALF
jgi:hypothetical protein